MAIYKFITDQDLRDLLREHYEDLTDNNPKNIRQAEATAVELIKSKLADRHDMALVMLLFSNWDSATEYTAGQYVVYGPEDRFYLALVDNDDVKPSSDPNTWKESDPRNPLLVMHCMYITIWYLSQKISLRKVPDQWADNYDEAMEWLNDVRDLKENPELPLKENGSDEIPWGSNDRTEYNY